MKLIIPKSIEDKIHAYAMSAEGEIAGMGKVRVEDASRIVVEEVMIYEQEATGATADLSTKALARFQTELVQAGGSPKMWRLWFHSHANMAAFFSKRDTDTMDEHADSDWLISLVVNKKREREARLDLYAPFRMYMGDLDIEIEGEQGFIVPPEIAAEVALKVKRPDVKVSEWGYGTKGNSLASGVDLHLYCPMYTKGEKKCYSPYGKDGVSVYTNCTTPEFKKMYGGALAKEQSVRIDMLGAVRDSMDGDPQTKAELMENIKILGAEIDDLENNGMGDSKECMELTTELADAYYSLAEEEADEDIAESMRSEARLLENTVYALSENARGIEL